LKLVVRVGAEISPDPMLIEEDWKPGSRWCEMIRSDSSPDRDWRPKGIRVTQTDLKPINS